jgi:spermidine synthase
LSSPGNDAKISKNGSIVVTAIGSIKNELYPLTDANVIYRTRDEYGDIIVYEVDRRRILTFGSIFEQSCIELDDPAQLVHQYTQAMLLPLLEIEPGHVTLLGLGGGGLVHGLFHALPDAEIDVVELRQAVIDVARSQFLLPRSERVRVHCADAGAYVGNAMVASTDLLLCDLFEADEACAMQLDPAFYRRCKLLLKPDGWLAINYHQLLSVEHPSIEALQEHFAAVLLCVVASGNWVVLASNSSLACEGDEWQRQRQRVGVLRRQLAFHSHRLIRL